MWLRHRLSLLLLVLLVLCPPASVWADSHDEAGPEDPPPPSASGTDPIADDSDGDPDDYGLVADSNVGSVDPTVWESLMTWLSGLFDR